MKLINREPSWSEDLHLAVAGFALGDHHIKNYHPHGSEWYFIMKGECIVYVGENEIKVGPGTIIYLPPGTVHGAKNDSNEYVEMLVGISRPDYIDGPNLR